jgi:malonate transporter and related proteins
MIDFVLLSLPVFGVVALGWLATRTHLIAPAGLDVLGAFSFRCALPPLLVRLIGSQPLGRSFNPVFYGGYLGCGALVFATVFGFSLWFVRRGAGVAAARAMTAAVSNCGFLGPPLMLAFFGERGAGPLAMAILAEIMVLLTVGGVIMGISQVARDSGAAAGSRSKLSTLVVRATVLNPVVVSIVLGAALAASNVRLPVSIDRFLAFLGGSAGPTALFALGGVLGLQRIDRATALVATAISAVKLVAYPLLVWWVLGRVLQLDSLWVQTGVLVAALPSASSNFVMAQRYATDPEGVSAAILLTTVASVVTVPLVAWILLG